MNVVASRLGLLAVEVVVNHHIAYNEDLTFPEFITSLGKLVV
jgi:hypothetical protein